MIHVAALAGVEGAFDPSGGVSNQKEPNLVARPIAVCEKAHLTRPQVVGLDTYGRICVNLDKLRSARHRRQPARDYH